MTDHELRKLSRAELLEMLVEQGRQMEQLQKKADELQKQLDDKTIKLNKAGSIAAASLALNGVFEAAQAAADQYVGNLREIYAKEKEIYKKLKAKEGQGAAASPVPEAEKAEKKALGEPDKESAQEVTSPADEEAAAPPVKETEEK